MKLLHVISKLLGIFMYVTSWRSFAGLQIVLSPGDILTLSPQSSTLMVTRSEGNRGIMRFQIGQECFRVAEPVAKLQRVIAN